MLPSEYIKRGWCQGAHAISHNGRRCDLDSPKVKQVDIVGALLLSDEAPANKFELVMQAVDDDRKRRLSECEDLTALTSERWRELKKPSATLIEWQDQEFRTKEDVIRVLRSVGL